jgi:hypothetical protein
MKTPKILPWLARKHGVSEARATKLWASALRYATDKTGWVGTPEYWSVSMERFLELLEAEVSPCQPPLSVWVRIQGRIGLLPLIAGHGLAIIASQVWGRAGARRQGTA